MPWGANSWLRFTKEASYGVRNPSPGGTDVCYVRLAQNNAFGMRVVPQRQIIRTAEAGNRRRIVVGARKMMSGNLATILYPTQAAFFLNAGCTLTASDLPSYTVDYNDSTRVIGCLGVKVAKLNLPSTSNQDWVPLHLDLVGQQIDASFTSFTQPADSNYPSEVPYEHVETSGHVTVGGSTLTKYSSLNVTVTNHLSSNWDENTYISSLFYCGRDVDFSFRAQYMSATWRTDLEAQAAIAASLGWNRASPAHSITFDLKSSNYIATIADEIPLDNATYQTVNVQTFYDGTAATDLALTVV